MRPQTRRIAWEAIGEGRLARGLIMHPDHVIHRMRCLQSVSQLVRMVDFAATTS